MEGRFIYENGIRRVAPYYFEYVTPFKSRWCNKTVVEVMTLEFGQTVLSIERRIIDGKIFVSKNNGKSGGPVFIRGTDVLGWNLRPHDKLHNVQHIHEPCVVCSGLDDGTVGLDGTARLDGLLESGESSKSAHFCENSINIISNKKYLVISKPSGLPTHPGGSYRYNTLTEILKSDLGYDVWPCHRLDKATLGLLILGKSKETCSEMMKKFQERSGLAKWYLARVCGKFPARPFAYECPVFSINSNGGYVNVSSIDRIPLDSTTVFSSIIYHPETDETVILCRPLSGRMHQIRIHLRNLGYPIVNDEFYNSGYPDNREKSQLEMLLYGRLFESKPSRLWTIKEEKEEKDREIEDPGTLTLDPVNWSLVHSIDSEGSPKSSTASSSSSTSNLVEKISSEMKLLSHWRYSGDKGEFVSLQNLMDDSVNEKLKEISSLRKQRDNSKIIGLCSECSASLYTENLDLALFLHAYLISYSGDNPFSYTTKLPRWVE